MNTTQLRELFKKHNKEYCKFFSIKKRYAQRPDLHAFLLLDKILTKSEVQFGIISAAERDEIFLRADLDELARLITEEQVIELIQCGVRCTEFECLGMFV